MREVQQSLVSIPFPELAAGGCSKYLDEGPLPKGECSPTPSAPPDPPALPTCSYFHSLTWKLQPHSTLRDEENKGMLFSHHISELPWVMCLDFQGAPKNFVWAEFDFLVWMLKKVAHL